MHAQLLLRSILGVTREAAGQRKDQEGYEDAGQHVPN